MTPTVTVTDRAARVEAALERAFHPDEIVAHAGAREIRLCAGTACHASGRVAVREAFKEELATRGLAEEWRIVETGCHGFCEQGPIVLVEPEGYFYPRVKPSDVPDIVQTTLVEGGVIEKLMYKHPQTGAAVPHERDIPFYKLQQRLVLALNGRIDPYSIDDYMAHGGYRGLAKALSGGDPDGIIAEVEHAGLRGRGGAGFPTGKKWRFCRANPGDKHYVICNADEGDPGAFMDRSVIEGNPHSVVEGMIIAAFAIGSDEGYVYVRHEYPFAVQRLGAALLQCHERGLLGENILDSGFNFEIHVSQGAGAFVCGESTALTASIEGLRGMPRGKHIRTVAQGLWGQPTNLNNVETYATVPWIVQHGAEAFRTMGTETSKGTKIFSLTGATVNGGLIEVPMGASLRHVIFDIGGGMLPGRTFKAVQLGGPSGGCLPEHELDLPVDFDALDASGAMLGSGGLVVVDDTTCMVDFAKYFLQFTADESCGKCVPCRVGTRRMLEVLERIVSGAGKASDIGMLEELSEYIADGTTCALGGSAPGPVLTTLRYFRGEYEAHIREKMCPAGQCKALITYYIDPDACTGCTLCAKKCPVSVISGEKKQPHVIDVSACIKCDTCRQVCRFNAVKVRSGIRQTTAGVA